MPGKTVAISQSSYIPWKGYFDMINSVDCFVFLEDVQYTRRDWRNRNLIKTGRGETGKEWLTIPVEAKGNFLQSINEVKVVDSNWAGKHFRTFCHRYARAPYFRDLKEWLEDLYLRAEKLEYLSEINQLFIRALCHRLSIDTELRCSAEFTLTAGKNERLLSICHQLGADRYVSGPAAKSYMDERLFQSQGVSVKWHSYEGYKEYEQLYPPFDHHVSIIDLLAHAGPDAHQFMLSFKPVAPAVILN